MNSLILIVVCGVDLFRMESWCTLLVAKPDAGFTLPSCVFESKEFDVDTLLICVRGCADDEQLLGSGVKVIDILSTSPCRLPLGCYPHHLLVVSDARMIEKVLCEAGVAVLNSCIDVALLGSVKRVCDARIAQATAALTSLGIACDKPARFREIASREPYRFDLLLAGYPREFGADDVVADGHSDPVAFLAFCGCWVGVVRSLLGASRLRVSASVIYSLPGAGTQQWHADGEVFGACVFIPLITLTQETGFTQFYPESHHISTPGFGEVCLLHRAEFDGVLKLGDALLYDYRTIHRGMPNTSESTRRPILQLVYHDLTYTEQVNYGTKSLFHQCFLRCLFFTGDFGTAAASSSTTSSSASVAE